MPVPAAHAKVIELTEADWRATAEYLTALTDHAPTSEFTEELVSAPYILLRLVPDKWGRPEMPVPAAHAKVIELTEADWRATAEYLTALTDHAPTSEFTEELVSAPYILLRLVPDKWGRPEMPVPAAHAKVIELTEADWRATAEYLTALTDHAPTSEFTEELVSAPYILLRLVPDKWGRPEMPVPAAHAKVIELTEADWRATAEYLTALTDHAPTSEFTEELVSAPYILLRLVPDKWGRPEMPVPAAHAKVIELTEADWRATAEYLTALTDHAPTSEFTEELVSAPYILLRLVPDKWGRPEMPVPAAHAKVIELTEADWRATAEYLTALTDHAPTSEFTEELVSAPYILLRLVPDK